MEQVHALQVQGEEKSVCIQYSALLKCDLCYCQLAAIEAVFPNWLLDKLSVFLFSEWQH